MKIITKWQYCIIWSKTQKKRITKYCHFVRKELNKPNNWFGSKVIVMCKYKTKSFSCLSWTESGM